MVLIHKHFHFVVATPQAETSMVTNTANVFSNFHFDVFFKLFGQFVNGTSEHKVFPNQQTQFVTDVKEKVIRIVTTTPNTDRVEVCIFTLFQQLIGGFVVDTPQNIVFRNVVSTHRKNIDAVDGVGKFIAVFILFGVHTKGAQTDAFAALVDDVAVHQLHHIDGVERLFAQPIWPPNLWICNGEVGFIIGGNSAVRCSHFNFIGRRTIGEETWLYIDGKGNGAIGMCLCHIEVFYFTNTVSF